MTREEAIAMANSAWWVGKTPIEIVRFQINEELLCVPFSIFHEAVEKVLDRPVYTHEFAFAMFRNYIKELVR